MLKTAPELLRELGLSIRARRIAQHWSQEEAAARAGIGVRTWRRMEANGQATIETLVNAAIALRCEEKVLELFPAPHVRSMDELLQQQRLATSTMPRRRASRKARRV